MRYARLVGNKIPVNEVVVETSPALSQGDSGEPLPCTIPKEMAPKLVRGMTRRVVEGTLLYGIGQSLPQVVRMLLMLTVFVHFLRPSDYGLIELANCFGAFSITFMRMGVPGAVTRFYFDHSEGEPLRNYVTTIAWFLLICSLVVGCLAGLLWPVAAIWLPGLTFYPLAFLAIVGGVVTVNMELQNRLVQAREQASYQARLTILRATISITLALLFVVALRLGALGMFAGEVASYGVLGLIAVWYLRPELHGRFQRPLLGDSLKYGMGQVPGDLVNTLVPLITRGFLAKVVSTAALGLLAVAVRFTQPLTILINAFQTAYNPIYFSVRKEATPDSLHRLATAARGVWMVAVFCALGRGTAGAAAHRAFDPQGLRRRDATLANSGNRVSRPGGLYSHRSGNLLQQEDLVGAGGGVFCGDPGRRDFTADRETLRPNRRGMGLGGADGNVCGAGRNFFAAAGENSARMVQLRADRDLWAAVGGNFCFAARALDYCGLGVGRIGSGLVSGIPACHRRSDGPRSLGACDADPATFAALMFPGPL